jgi:protein-tyrosine-phosphatase
MSCERRSKDEAAYLSLGVIDMIVDFDHEHLSPRSAARGARASGDRGEALRVLFLCTGNSARSQIAEALLTRKAHGRFVVKSAGTEPAAAVNPGALEVLRDYGIEWDGHPKHVDSLRREKWDLVITVCDKAKESCPTMPGEPMFAHWGMPDPAAVEDDEARRRAFRETIQFLSRRIDLLLALPIESLERRALELRLDNP